jgi:hypothetical protein
MAKRSVPKCRRAEPAHGVRILLARRRGTMVVDGLDDMVSLGGTLSTGV